tara:strand:+ start:364 stop:840 length:477 start_codon:yes stop_codon:yes gene_type:complete
MKNQRHLPTLLLATLLAFFSAQAFADTLVSGDAFPTISATDQHEAPYAITNDTAHVIVSFDMTPGKKANAYLEEQGASFLPDNKAIFIANIYGMPGIGRFFAIPKMQKYPHRILLADEKGLLDNFPTEKGKVTVFTLDSTNTITGISFWNPKDGSSPF